MANYTFKHLNFNDYQDDFFNKYDNNPFQNTNSGGCFRCKNPCNFPPKPPRPPQNCKPCPPPNCNPPLENFPFPCPPLPPQDCSKDNFRYFLIGYLFGSWN